MPNPTGPTAAEGMSEFKDIEATLHELTLAVRMCDSHVQGALYPSRGVAKGEDVTVGAGDRELVAYASTHAHDMADRLREEFYALVARPTLTQDVGTNHLADTLDAHMAGVTKSYGPSLADQLRTQMGRSVFHNDTDKPATDAAEQARKFNARSVLRLETPIYDARSAARVAEFMAFKLYGGSDANSRTVTESERELLLYAVAHAARLAEAADDAFQALNEETDR